MSLSAVAMSRAGAFGLAFVGAALLSACVFAPPSSTTYSSDPAAITKMSEQAVTTCGAGQVKEVNAKSFSCK